MSLQRLTAEKSERDQARVAGALQGRGLGPGDRVAFVCPNSAELVSAVIGATRVGIAPVPVNPALHASEQEVILDDADPGLVVRAPALAALLEGPAAELAPAPLVRPMHYTSGTTGRPKGVWSGVLDERAALAQLDDEARVWRFARDDVMLVCSPLYHSAPLRFSTGTLLAGGQLLVLERFDARQFVHTAVEARPTLSFVVPAHLQRLLALGDLPDLPSFRLLAHAGAPCPEPLKRAALAAFPAGTVWEFYGSTEGQFTACSPDEWEARPGTVGRARPGRRMSVDGDGMVWCEVPAFARFEYWRDPVRTAEAWQGDSFTSGDLGHLDDDCYLFLESRREDLIISGGVNVYPVEVENVLAGLSGVEDVAVFGVSDERWGQRVCAAVVGSVQPDAVLRHARAHLAAYKCPKAVYVVRELPRSGTGKVRRSAVVAELGL